MQDGRLILLAGAREHRPEFHTETVDYEVFRLLFTLLKVFERLLPSPPIAVIAATAISAAIRPYSMAVAPSSFLKSFLIIFISGLQFIFTQVAISSCCSLTSKFITEWLSRHGLETTLATLFDIEFHIPVVEPATLPSAVSITMTSIAKIKPYSTAVAPRWHFAMLRISSKILVPVYPLVANSHRFPTKPLTKTFEVETKCKKIRQC
jgi:hypothetical protein